MGNPSEPADIRQRLTAYQPLFGLTVSTPRLTLRMPTDPDLIELLQVIEQGVHDPTFMPFRFAWTDVPSPQRERESLSHWWRGRASWTTSSWQWTGAVRVEGQLVGVQDLMAENYPSLGEVKSGSFLGLGHQGHGIGREMRAAILHLAFEGLGAKRAFSGYLEGNEASKRVSESLGYVPNGYSTAIIRGMPVREFHLVLEREVWKSQRRDDIRIQGLDECLELFGVASRLE
jgi:RimJ/RimL family protein N-acetyltransferase